MKLVQNYSFSHIFKSDRLFFELNSTFGETESGIWQVIDRIICDYFSPSKQFSVYCTYCQPTASWVTNRSSSQRILCLLKVAFIKSHMSKYTKNSYVVITYRLFQLIVEFFFLTISRSRARRQFLSHSNRLSLPSMHQRSRL